MLSIVQSFISGAEALFARISQLWKLKEEHGFTGAASIVVTDMANQWVDETKQEVTGTIASIADAVERGKAVLGNVSAVASTNGTSLAENTPPPATPPVAVENSTKLSV